MRDFLTAYIDDIQGVGKSSWIFRGTVSFTDEQNSGYDPLEPYYSVDGSSNEIDIICGDSSEVVDLQLYQLVDRALNPWLLFNQVAVRLNSAAKAVW